MRIHFIFRLDRKQICFRQYFFMIPQLFISSIRSSTRLPNRGCERSAGIGFHAAPRKRSDLKNASFLYLSGYPVDPFVLG